MSTSMTLLNDADVELSVIVVYLTVPPGCLCCKNGDGRTGRPTTYPFTLLLIRRISLGVLTSYHEPRAKSRQWRADISV